MVARTIGSSYLATQENIQRPRGTTNLHVVAPRHSGNECLARACMCVCASQQCAESTYIQTPTRTIPPPFTLQEVGQFQRAITGMSLAIHGHRPQARFAPPMSASVTLTLNDACILATLLLGYRNWPLAPVHVGGKMGDTKARLENHLLWTLEGRLCFWL